MFSKIVHNSQRFERPRPGEWGYVGIDLISLDDGNRQMLSIVAELLRDRFAMVFPVASTARAGRAALGCASALSSGRSAP